MIILGLDLALNKVGYAVFEDGELYTLPQSYGVVWTDGKLTQAGKLVSLRDTISALITRFSPDEVVIEDTFRGPNVTVFKTLSRCTGVIMELVRRELHKDPQVFLATQVRKPLKVKKKEEVFEYFNQKYQLKLDFKKDNDITDAMVLCYGYYAISHSPEVPAT